MKNSDLITLLGQYPANAEVSILDDGVSNDNANGWSDDRFDIAAVSKPGPGLSFIDLKIGRQISSTSEGK